MSYLSFFLPKRIAAKTSLTSIYLQSKPIEYKSLKNIL